MSRIADLALCAKENTGSPSTARSSLLLASLCCSFIGCILLGYFPPQSCSVHEFNAILDEQTYIRMSVTCSLSTAQASKQPQKPASRSHLERVSVISQAGGAHEHGCTATHACFPLPRDLLSFQCQKVTHIGTLLHDSCCTMGMSVQESQMHMRPQSGLF